MNELQFVVHQRNNQLERANKRLREALEAIAGDMEAKQAYCSKHGLLYGLLLTSFMLDNLIAKKALDYTKPGRLPKDSNGELK